LNTNWTISNSPIEFPISDVGLVTIYLENYKANYYLLPVGRNLLLQGIFYYDNNKNSSLPVIQGIDLAKDQAEYNFSCICASAISELICAEKLPNIQVAREQSRARGIRFCKLTNPKDANISGLVDVGQGDFLFRIVSIEEYKQIVHSYMRPWN
jgi:hypothetical protein